MSIFSRAYAGPVVVMVLLGGLPVAGAHAAEASYSILHSFQSGESNPQASLTSDGRGNLYGTTAHGGLSDGGTVFTVRADGTGFQRLHTFTGGASDGFEPEASLVLDGAGNLYGTTSAGGPFPSSGGTVFRVRTDGSGFEILHSFAGGDGSYPHASLALDGSGNLYGTTYYGGPSNGGTVFRLRTDGTGFQLLHAFAGGPSDGRGPLAALLLDESGNLYGTTIAGGQPFGYSVPLGDFYDGAGTVFRIKTDGTGFQLLHAFPVAANDGSNPSGSLTTDGSGTLYGMTQCGGSSSGGTVFRIGKDGSGFQVLHSFADGASDGSYPVGSLVLDRSGALYGVTRNGGSAGDQATIFKIRTDGTGYQLMHAFIDRRDGTTPSSSLILDASETLYGTMALGGSSNAGTVFGINADGSFFQVLHAFAGFRSDGGHPTAPVIPDGSGYFYGTTAYGGFSYSGAVFRMRSDGTGFQLLHAFIGGANDGAGPLTSLILDRAGNLYGTTHLGGPSNNGTVFKMRTDGTEFQLLHTFLDGAGDGLDQVSGLILDGADNLFGTATGRGSTELGTVFRMKTDGTGFQILHTFTFTSGSTSASDGSDPLGPLVLDGSGNLYGTAVNGGPSNLGTVFKLRTDGTGFQLLHSFTGSADDGSEPSGFLIMDGLGNVFGTTTHGGSSSSSGTVFKMKTGGTGFQLLHSFVGGASDGSAPCAPVILDSSGNLYGTTYYGGPSESGTVFTVRTDGTGFRVLHEFGVEPGDGRNSLASLFLDGSGILIGTTVYGGTGGFGTVFALSIGRHHAVVTPGPFLPVRRRGPSS